MSEDTEKLDIDISRIHNGYHVTWKGRDLNKEWLDVDKDKKGRSSKIVALTMETLLERDGRKCRKCPRTEWLTVEHVVPVQILDDMGIPRWESYKDLENLEILCKICNGFKGGRLDFADPRTKIILMRYLERL